MKATQRILTAHKRYVKRKRLGSFLALEINIAVVVMDIVLWCFGCGGILTTMWMLVVLIYNAAWFHTEITSYQRSIRSQRLILKYRDCEARLERIQEDLTFWASAFRAQRDMDRGKMVGSDGINLTLRAKMRLDTEDCIMFGSRQASGGILSQIKEEKL